MIIIIILSVIMQAIAVKFEGQRVRSRAISMMRAGSSVIVKGFLILM
jgi:hypothetical protein